MEWQNLLWNKSTISIEKTVTEVNGRAMVGEPKTKSSRRTIALPEVVLEALKPNKKPEGFIFQTSAGTPIAPRNLLRHFYLAMERAGVPRISFHSLRHSCATILLQQDVHPKKVQELLGHSSIVLTLDTYSHIIPAAYSETAEKMDEVLK